MLAQVEGLSVSITSGTTAWGALKLGKGREGKTIQNNSKSEMQKHSEFFAEQWDLKTFAYD
jgi:hypothetical protein